MRSTPCSGGRSRTKPINQNREHPIGNLPSVVPKVELGEILGQVLPRDMDMRPSDAPLQLRPVVLDAVGMNAVSRPFLRPVIDRVMIEAASGELPIREPLIGIYG